MDLYWIENKIFIYDFSCMIQAAGEDGEVVEQLKAKIITRRRKEKLEKKRCEKEK